MTEATSGRTGTEEFLGATQGMDPQERYEALQAWTVEGLRQDVRRAVGEFTLVVAVLARDERGRGTSDYYKKLQKVAETVSQRGDFSLDGIADLKAGIGVTGALKGENA